MSNIWFTSDTHFGHTFVAKQRGFPCADTMNQHLIDCWNRRVQKADIVYHLGDFTLNKAQYAEAMRKSLNGQIHLVLGNHDKWLNEKTRKLFAWIGDYKEIRVEGQKIVLSHYPFLTWHHSGKGAWNLHGHCHCNLPKELKGKRMDVGVDGSYWPYSFNEIAIEMAAKDIDIVDHHIDETDMAERQ